MTTDAQRERILSMAYELWEAEGRPSGRDMEHWIQAELLVLSEKPKAKRTAKAPAKAKTASKAKAKAKPAAKPKPKKSKA